MGVTFLLMSREDNQVTLAKAFDEVSPRDCKNFAITYSAMRGASVIGDLPMDITNADGAIEVVRRVGYEVGPKEAYKLAAQGKLVFATQDSYETGNGHGHIAPVLQGTGDFQNETSSSTKPGWGEVRHPFLANQAYNGAEGFQSLRIPASKAFVSPPKYYVVPDNGKR